MKTHFLILVLVASLIVGAAPAAAQADDLPGNETTTTTDQDGDAPERIDENTLLVEKRLEDDDTAVIVLKSEKTQRVTLTDWGQFLTDGPVESQQYIIKAGETTTIRHPIVLQDGMGGVTISTSSVTWSVKLEDRYEFLPGGPRVSDVQLAGLTGLGTTGLLAIAIAIKRRRGIGDEVERIV